MIKTTTGLWLCNVFILWFMSCMPEKTPVHTPFMTVFDSLEITYDFFFSADASDDERPFHPSQLRYN